MRLNAAQAVEVAVAHGRSFPGVLDVVAVGSHHVTCELRWANNTMTSNGSGWSTNLTVVAFVARDGGVATATRSENDPDFDVAFVHDLVERTIAAARRGEIHDHGFMPNVATIGNWDAEPVESDLTVVGRVVPQIGRTLRRGGRAGFDHSGYVEHSRSSIWVGSLSGIALRDDSEDGRVEMTCRADGGARSAWEGVHTRDFTDIDVDLLESRLSRQLGWQKIRRELAPGRYRTILTPGAVGDLMSTFDANLGARDALEGSGPFAGLDGATLIGSRVGGGRNFDVYSDPFLPAVRDLPYVVDTADSAVSSVFDTGMATGRTHWVRDGILETLCATRAVAAEFGVEHTPDVGNLVLDVAGAQGDLDDVIARTESALLVNTLWYIRDLDEATMTVTGTTRDGVYEIRDGQVVAAVNNFRWNESPLSVLGRIVDAGTPVLCQTRENAETVSDYLMPALVVDGFTMSSVSEAN